MSIYIAGRVEMVYLVIVERRWIFSFSFKGLNQVFPNFMSGVDFMTWHTTKQVTGLMARGPWVVAPRRKGGPRASPGGKLFTNHYKNSKFKGFL